MSLSKKDLLLDVWSKLFEAHPLAVREVEKSIKNQAELGLDEYDFLLILSRQVGHKERLSSLSKKTLYTKSGVTRLSKRMKERGYIKFETCKEDKRGSYAVLTTKGISALKQTWTHYRQAIVDTLDPCLELEEAKVLGKLLLKIIDTYSSETIVQISRKTR